METLLQDDDLARQRRSMDQKLNASQADSGDTKWAASQVDLAPSTLNKMRVYGTGPPFYRLGRAVRYRRLDLEEWRNQFRVASTTEADVRLPKSLTSKPIS